MACADLIGVPSGIRTYDRTILSAIDATTLLQNPTILSKSLVPRPFLVTFIAERYYSKFFGVKTCRD
ncbi:hypothetical protein YSA_00729 [Pseudomonas putida ND6]|uniref:Uncharacterized protein n=1 Tax=Pseudomonas putida ND6 TaxID=231023 RepID=I3UNV2_PSEPU|nr:hypothetical protein YSA_00729 [Pseudomonas putida ND6]